METLAAAPPLPLAHPRSFFIGGAWVQPSSSAAIDVINAATEEVALTVAEAQVSDIRGAIGAPVLRKGRLGRGRWLKRFRHGGSPF